MKRLGRIHVDSARSGACEGSGDFVCDMPGLPKSSHDYFSRSREDFLYYGVEIRIQRSGQLAQARYLDINDAYRLGEMCARFFRPGLKVWGIDRRTFWIQRLHLH